MSEYAASYTVNPVTAWSYSRYAKYSLCPLQFKLEVIQKKGRVSSKATERGELIHKAIANFLNGAGAMPPEIHDPFHKQLYAEMTAFPDKVVEQQWAFTQKWEPTAWFGQQTWYRQVVDLGILYEDGTSVELVDHKSGKRYASNDDQMELQALSTFCHFKPAQQVTTRLVYIDAGHHQDEIAEFKREDVPKLKSKWEAKVAPMFTDTIFAPRPNERCRFCTFARSNGGECRYG